MKLETSHTIQGTRISQNKQINKITWLNTFGTDNTIPVHTTCLKQLLQIRQNRQLGKTNAGRQTQQENKRKTNSISKMWAEIGSKEG
uniref:Uncharacterized protein n=1 Tax=Anguilla anguilla TaxID=7936 RepID=A0A0E9XEY1_ANGAN